MMVSISTISSHHLKYWHGDCAGFFTTLVIEISYTLVHFMVKLIRFSDHPYTYLSNTVMVCNKRMPIPYLCWKVYKKIILMSQAFLRKLFFTTSLQTQLSSWRPFFFTIKVWGSYLWHNVWHRSRIPRHT